MSPYCLCRFFHRKMLDQAYAKGNLKWFFRGGFISRFENIHAFQTGGRIQAYARYKFLQPDIVIINNFIV